MLRDGKGRARECLKLLDDCRAFAWVPCGWSDDHVYALRHGGGVDRDQRLPTDTLWRFLEEDDPGFRRMLVFEDPYARRDDSTFRERRHATPVAFMDDDVYQVIAREQRGDAIYLPVAEYAEGYLVLDRGLLQLA